MKISPELWCAMEDEYQSIRRLKRELLKLRRQQKQGFVVAHQMDLVNAAQAAAEYAHERCVTLRMRECVL